SCAMLPCTPAMNEGDVTLSSSDTVFGCHAYERLTIASFGSVTAGRDPVSGIGFAACAKSVLIGGSLSASGQGELPAAGPGAGRIAIYTVGASSTLKTDVKGGTTMAGGADGLPGTVYKSP